MPEDASEKKGETFEGEYNYNRYGQAALRYVGTTAFLLTESYAIVEQNLPVGVFGFAYAALAVNAYRRSEKRRDEIIKEELGLNREENN